MSEQRILFIGGGNMTRAMVSGLISNQYSGHAITVFDRNAHKRAFFSEEFHVETSDQLSAELCDVDFIVLSVKPQSAIEICLQLRAFLQHQKTCILSVMAGLTINTLIAWLGEKISIVRAMPNTPSLVKAGATGLFAGESVTVAQKQQSQFLMSSIGITAWVELENHIDVITALSGSGPAYFFYMIEAMQATAIELGLPESIAKEFSLQTAFGAALLAKNSNESISELRAKVTSKNGTTEAALTVFQQNDFSVIVQKAMLAAKKRAEALGARKEF